MSHFVSSVVSLIYKRMRFEVAGQVLMDALPCTPGRQFLVINVSLMLGILVRPEGVLKNSLSVRRWTLMLARDVDQTKQMRPWAFEVGQSVWLRVYIVLVFPF